MLKLAPGDAVTLDADGPIVAPAEALSFGDDVQVAGSISRPELNGIYGKIVGRSQDGQGRWEVQIIGKQGCTKKFHSSLLKKTLPVRAPGCNPACVVPTNCIGDSFSIFFSQSTRLLTQSGLQIPTGLSEYWEHLFSEPLYSDRIIPPEPAVVDVQPIGSGSSTSTTIISEKVGKYWVPHPFGSTSSTSTTDINIKDEDDLRSPFPSGNLVPTGLSNTGSGNTNIAPTEGGFSGAYRTPARREYPSIPNDGDPGVCSGAHGTSPRSEYPSIPDNPEPLGVQRIPFVLPRNPELVREYKISDVNYAARHCIQQAIDCRCCRATDDNAWVLQSAHSVQWNLLPEPTRLR